MYPDKTPKERENAIVREHHTVFLMQIGGKLKSGKPHDGRAPDYDDWQLNGDILMWNPVLECAFEISSMGIRVDEASLDRQLTLAGCDDRRDLPFHKMLLHGELPLTMGGGIGQSRVCMLMIGTCHIGEVQSSIWDKATIDAAIDQAMRELREQGVHGKETTPFLLARVVELTGGDSLESNIQLVLNNARLASKTAAALCR